MQQLITFKRNLVL